MPNTEQLHISLTMWLWHWMRWENDGEMNILCRHSRRWDRSTILRRTVWDDSEMQLMRNEMQWWWNISNYGEIESKYDGIGVRMIERHTVSIREATSIKFSQCLVKRGSDICLMIRHNKNWLNESFRALCCGHGIDCLWLLRQKINTVDDIWYDWICG